MFSLDTLNSLLLPSRSLVELTGTTGMRRFRSKTFEELSRVLTGLINSILDKRGQPSLTAPISIEDSHRIYMAVFRGVFEALITAGYWRLPTGLGSFKVRRYRPKGWYNPNTRQVEKITAQEKIEYTPGSWVDDQLLSHRVVEAEP
jgi:nucleoid DNA-binding protein